ncbi:MAG: hypothetical protein IT393_03410 [Nitrospirae bacterium]|nr:hypothetical protein [Nitrospirota bacterium]
MAERKKMFGASSLEEEAVAHRPVDMADIQSLIDAHEDMDFSRIRQWVREFSSVLEMPEIYTDLEKILTQRKMS